MYELVFTWSRTVGRTTETFDIATIQSAIVPRVGETIMFPEERMKDRKELAFLSWIVRDICLYVRQESAEGEDDIIRAFLFIEPDDPGELE